MAVFFDPNTQGGGGNLAQAIGLWDKFLGPTSKANKQALTNAEQTFNINAAEEERNKTKEVDRSAMQVPTLSGAKATAEKFQLALDDAKVDHETKQGGINAINNAPPEFWSTTDAIERGGKLDAFKQFATSHGVKDFGAFAIAWNRAQGEFGRTPKPAGGTDAAYTYTPGAGMASTGLVLPNLIERFNNLFPADPGAASAAPTAPGAPPQLPQVSAGPGAVGAPGVAAASPSSPAPSGGRFSNLSREQLLKVAADPALSKWFESGLDMENKQAALRDKEQSFRTTEQTAENARQANLVPLLNGRATSPEQAKQMNILTAEILSAGESIDKLLAMMEPNYGGSMSYMQKRAYAQTLQGTLVGQLRVALTGPGAMNVSEQELLKDLIANPTSLFTLDSSNKQKLNTLKETLNRKVENAARSVGIENPVWPPKDSKGAGQAKMDFPSQAEFVKNRDSLDAQVGMQVTIGGVPYELTAGGWVPASSAGGALQGAQNSGQPQGLPNVTPPAAALPPGQAELAEVLKQVMPKLLPNVPPQISRPQRF